MDDLDADRLQILEIAGVTGQIGGNKRHSMARNTQGADHLHHSQRTRILIEERQLVIDDENSTTSSHAHVTCVSVSIQVRRRRRRTENQLIAPAPAELLLVGDLKRRARRIQVDPRFRHVVLNDRGVRLINHLVPCLTNLKGQIRGLVVSMRVFRLEASKPLEQGAGESSPRPRSSSQLAG